MTPCAVSVCRRQVSPHINQQLNNSRAHFSYFFSVLSFLFFSFFSPFFAFLFSAENLVKTRATLKPEREKRKPNDSRAEHNEHVVPPRNLGRLLCLQSVEEDPGIYPRCPFLAIRKEKQPLKPFTRPCVSVSRDYGGDSTRPARTAEGDLNKMSPHPVTPHRSSCSRESWHDSRCTVRATLRYRIALIN